MSNQPAAPYDEEELPDDEKSDFPNMAQRQSWLNQGQRYGDKRADEEDDDRDWDSTKERRDG